MTVLRTLAASAARALLALALAAAARPLTAQETPRAAAEAYLGAMKAGEWSRAAELMHPAALDELKGFFTIVAEADTAGQVLPPMFGVHDAAEFRALSGQEVYARVLLMVSRTAPQLVQVMRGMENEVVGVVSEGADTAHVVYRVRMTIDGDTSEKVQVLSLRRAGDRWLALLGGDLRSMAQSLTRALQRH